MTTLRCDVVIIGGGVIGLSIAAHLAASGTHSVMVVERGADHAQGSTSRATGGFRAQFGSAVNVRLSLLSLAKLECFVEEHGIDPGYTPSGYLFVAQSERAMLQLRLANELQHSIGVLDARVVDGDECRRIQPLLDSASIVGGTFSPRDGFIRPLEILNGYLATAKKHGVQMRYGARAVRSKCDADAVLSVELSDGTVVEAGQFVNASGAWAARVGDVFEEEIPVTPLKRQVAVTEPTEVLTASSPMTIVADDGWHTRPRDGRALLLLPAQPQSSDPYSTSIENAWLEKLSSRTAEVAPKLASVPIERGRCWAGLYEVSPDGHALLGRALNHSNFFLANGSSGHGVMHAPAIGEVVAQMIRGDRTSIDVSDLAPDRFKRGRPVQSIDLL